MLINVNGKIVCDEYCKYQYERVSGEDFTEVPYNDSNFINHDVDDDTRFHLLLGKLGRDVDGYPNQ
jgi:hypothetical protein